MANNDALAPIGDGNQYVVNNCGFSYYRYDYETGTLVPITPTEMQFELSHYVT